MTYYFYVDGKKGMTLVFRDDFYKKKEPETGSLKNYYFRREVYSTLR